MSGRYPYAQAIKPASDTAFSFGTAAGFYAGATGNCDITLTDATTITTVTVTAGTFYEIQCTKLKSGTADVTTFIAVR